jgi:dihydroorotate dehydrogenase subfamily 2
LEQEIERIKFRNPVLLAAGFDYDSRLTGILRDVGFGGETIGSITYKPYEGNPKPRLARLPNSKSLLVNKGLKNKGAKFIIEKMRGKKFQIPTGISIAKSNCAETCDDDSGIEDYISCLKLWEKSGMGDYYEINISCPNAFGGEPFVYPEKLNKLLYRVDKLNLKKPLFLKMPVDFSFDETDKLIKVAKMHKVSGLIFGNLTKERSNKLFDKKEIKSAGKGNFSGLPCKDKSDALIEFSYKKYGKRFIIIGAGGIFSAEDAYRKIELGASLVQLITGMIYNGPGLISEINRGIAERLKKEGYRNIKEAIGKRAKI